VDITAAILAGGEGRRVDGNDKGLVTLASRPLIAHVCGALCDQVGEILICANRNHDKYAGYGEVIADLIPGFKGPLAGIAAALSRCATLWLLTLPVDGPDLPGDLAVRLLAAVTTVNASAAVAHDGARRQPLFALYRADLASNAAQALQRGLGPSGWQREIGAIEVDFSDQPHAFANLNTLEDFSDWERRHGL